MAALNLTDAQKEFAKQLRTDTAAQTKPLRDQLRQNRQDLKAAIQSNNAGAITQLSERQGQLQGQLAAIHGKAMASFHAQLTPEQKAKLDELREQRKQRAANRMERWKARQGQNQSK
jgi:Spy/CpxP family protein refolding chaperone